MLNELMRSAGKLLLLELTRDTALKIAGPAGEWPQLSPQQIADELVVNIEAGSAGRPNKAVEIDNINKRVTFYQISNKCPFLLLISQMIARKVPSSTRDNELTAM